MKKTTSLAIIFFTLVHLLPTAFGGTGDNLLKNVDFDTDAEGGVTKWRVPTYTLKDDPSVVEQLKWGVEGVGGARCLTISTKEFVKAHLWWEQTVPCVGGNTYEVSAKIKGELLAGSAYGGVQVAVHFLDENGGYLGAQSIPDVQALSDTWQLIKGKVTAPDEAVKMGFRMGIDFKGGVKMFFKEPSLTEIPAN